MFLEVHVVRFLHTSQINVLILAFYFDCLSKLYKITQSVQKGKKNMFILFDKGLFPWILIHIQKRQSRPSIWTFAKFSKLIHAHSKDQTHKWSCSCVCSASFAIVSSEKQKTPVRTPSWLVDLNMSVSCVEVSWIGDFALRDFTSSTWRLLWSPTNQFHISHVNNSYTGFFFFILKKNEDGCSESTSQCNSWKSLKNVVCCET